LIYSRASKSLEGKEDVDLNEILSEFKQLRRKIISEKSASINSNKLPILYTYKVANADPSLFIRQCTKVYRNRYTTKK
jgi:hypothetical protein